jgi:CysZ protein
MWFVDNLKTGFSSYVKGVKFIFKHKLWYYFIFPAILSIGIYYLGKYFVGLEQSINDGLKENNPETLNELIWMNIELVISDGFYVIFTKFTKYIVIILLSPLLAMLSEKIEEIVTGNVYPLNFIQILHDVRRGAKIAFRNMFWEYFFLVIVLGLAAFFPKNEFKAILIFSIPMVIGFYYYGFGFIDYINERRRLNIKQSTYFVRNHRGLAFAIGSVYSLMFMIPFAGVILAPIFAITAATIAMHKIVGLDNNEWAIKKKEVLSGNKKDKKIDGSEGQNTDDTKEADTSESE